MEFNQIFSFMSESFHAAERFHFQSFSSNFRSVSLGSARSFGDIPDLFQPLDLFFGHHTLGRESTSRAVW